MENQEIVQPTQSNGLEPQSGIPGKPKRNYWKFLAMILFVYFLVTMSMFILYAGKGNMVSYYDNTQKTVSNTSPMPTQNPTETWEKYTDLEKKYTFLYPAAYARTIVGESSPLLNRNISWNVMPTSTLACRGDCPIVTSTQKITVDGVEATKVKGWIGEIGGGPAQSYIKYEVKYPDEEKYLTMYVWELPQDLRPSELPAADRKIQDISVEDERIFDQIVSTLRFTSQTGGGTDVSGWKTYTNTAYAYAFMCPPGLVLKNQADGAGDTVPANASMVIVSDSEHLAYADRLLDIQHKDLLVELAPTWHSENLQVGNAKAVKYTSTDDAMYFDIYHIPQGNGGLEIMVNKKASSFVINKILSTFVFSSK